MADDFQQLPILATPPLLQVDAADPDAGSRGDGFVRDQPGKRQNRKAQHRKAAPPPESPAAAVNPSVLLQDEVHLTRSARTVVTGEQPPPPLPAPVETAAGYPRSSHMLREPLPAPADPAVPQQAERTPAEEKPAATGPLPPAPPEHIHFTA